MLTGIQLCDACPCHEIEERVDPQTAAANGALQSCADVEPSVRRAILSHCAQLATFFGETVSTEFLPHIIHSLNDR